MKARYKMTIDSIQQKIIMIKCGRVFQKLKSIYDVPSSADELANQGIAIKIAQRFSVDHYRQSERNKAALLLSEIKFVEFFAGTKNTSSKDRKLFFLLRDPKSFITLSSSNLKIFIRYVVKKCCEITSSDRLTAIFVSQFSVNEISDVKYQFRQSMLNVVNERSSIQKRLSAWFGDAIEQKEVAAALALKKRIIAKQCTTSINPSQLNDTIKDIQVLRSAATSKET
jgi:hypothetical protein